MKKILTLCLMILLGWNSGQSQLCLPNGIELNSQADIDNFPANYPNCTEIGYDLIIDQSTNANITNLDSLIQIKKIWGKLWIDTNYSLTSLSGLDSITTVAGELSIYDNFTLTDISALSGLTSVGQGIFIYGNAALENLNGLENLTEAQDYLVIQDNASLVDLSGVSNITDVASHLRVYYNNSLESLDGFASLSSVGGELGIGNNNALTNLALANLTSVGGELKITSNPVLTNFSGLENVETIGDRIYIDENILLESISELTSLVSVRAIQITDNPVLSDLSGLANISDLDGNMELNNISINNLSTFSNLTNINEELRLMNLPGLVDLSGLDNLVSIGDSSFIRQVASGGLVILSNDNLQTFSGLDNLQRIGGFTYVRWCPQLASIEALSNLTIVQGDFVGTNGLWIEGTALESLAGLENLTTVNADLKIGDNDLLTNLSPLENLETVTGQVKLQYNALLSDISALQNVDFTEVSGLYVVYNEALSYCQESFICDYLNTGALAFFDENAAGCTDEDEVLIACANNGDNTTFVGQIINDLDGDCTFSTGDDFIENWLVHTSNDDVSYAVSTDSTGAYTLPVLEGDWTLNIVPPSSFWVACFTDTLLEATASNDSITTDFFVHPLGDCPYLEWSIGVNRFRVCDSNFVYIPYCNYGTQPAVDAVFSVTLDPFLTFLDADAPYTIENDGSITFELDTINPLDCGNIRITTFADCDSLMIGDFPCVDVTLMSDELCAPDPLWDESMVAVTGVCENDSIYFELKNIGSGNMSEPAQFRVEIVIDDIILMLTVDDYQLLAGETEILSYEIQGQGLRLEADQTPGHPVYTEVSAIVPNCNDILNDSILSLLPANNGDPFSETHCAPAVNSFDPNIKTAIPKGVGDLYEIDKDWKLNYTIEFQNTGNDVAYLVVIKDTLTGNVDLTTLRVLSASHDFTWSLNPDRELVFTFDNILLPDSTSNEPESHGYVQFSISSRADILPGETIENRAGIYFDFNEPIITPTVLHTIRKPVVTTSEELNWCAGESFQGQVIWQDSTIQLQTEFLEYDSIHFVHLKVLPQTTNTAFAEILIGEYFEGVLIESDTNFVISYTGQNGCDSLVTYTISGLTNIDQVNNPFRLVEVFPNPVTDVLHIRNHQNGEQQQWLLYNSIGEKVWSKTLSANELLDDVLMKDFSSGVYWLEVRTESSRMFWRVVRM